MTRNSKQKTPQNTCTVLFDGSCSMCSGIMDKIDHSSQKNRFTGVDLTKTAKLPQGISRRAANAEIHVIDSAGTVHKNADAMLKILEMYPRWRWLARMGRWPGIYALLRLGYRIVARYRHFVFGPAARLFWTKVVVCLGLLAGVLTSTPLWLGGNREFPLVPLFNWVPQLPFSLSTILFVAFLAALCAALVLRTPRKAIIATALLAGLLILFDQNRLHPWVYQYIFMLIALAFFSWDAKKGDPRANTTLNICRLIMIAIYFYSGLQKLNPDFMNSVFPWLMSPFTSPFESQAWTGLLLTGGILAPLVELGLGLALLNNRFRNMAVLLLSGMHLFILLCIGPLGHGWNSSVWPWNIAMIALLFALFWDVKTIRLREIFWVKGFAFQKIALLAFAALPLLSFFNLWDSYLSSSLYSGTVAQGTLYYNGAATAKLPPSVKKYAQLRGSSQRVYIQTWAVGELNSPPYPEPRVYKGIFRSICRQYSLQDDEIVLKLSSRPSWKAPRKTEIVTCENLK